MSTPHKPDSKTVRTLRRMVMLNATGRAVTQEPIAAHVKALIDAGLVTATAMRSGPFALPDGAVWLRLTADGEKLIAIEAKVRGE